MAIEFINCASFQPGHNVHYIQANVQAHHPRLWANVDLVGPKALRVVTDQQDQVLFHLAAIELYMYTLIALDGEMKYSPASKLIYVHLEKHQNFPTNVWIMARLSESELTPCFELDASRTYSYDEVFGDVHDEGE